MGKARMFFETETPKKHAARGATRTVAIRHYQGSRLTSSRLCLA
jgi:hypothetical protein